MNSLETNTVVKPSAPINESHPSLESELNNEIEPDDSGWRNLGGKQVWKASWAEYDARKRRRLDQQKQAEKARKRRKRNAAQNSATKRPHRSSNHVNKCNNGSARDPSRTVFSSQQFCNRTLNRQNGNHCCEQYINNNNNERSVFSNHNRGNALNRNTPLFPLDSELLAAAKDQFSRPPPTSYRPTIRFQRGEVLNPYPTEDRPNTSNSMNNPYLQAISSNAHHLTQGHTPLSCEACTCRNACFRRN